MVSHKLSRKYFMTGNTCERSEGVSEADFGCLLVIMPRRIRCNTTVLHRIFQDCTAVQLAYSGAMDLLPGRGARLHPRDTVLFAPLDLRIWHEHVAAPGVEVNADDIASSYPGQTATYCTLR